jgi:hypothetical protein
MFDIDFAHDKDFDTEQHRSYRESGWIGGPFTEVRYLLSCLTRINYFREHLEVWEPAAKEFITAHSPDSAWITRSRYFHDFAVLILKEIYRGSELGGRHPIRKELRTERIARSVVAHVPMSVDELAILLKTTAKQLERNSIAMLAHREFRRLTSDR